MLTNVENEFIEYPNSLVFETMLPDDMTDEDENRTGYKKKMEKELTDSLSLVSSFYIYTGTPPHGYGTQAPKVAETVSRAYKFNKRKSDKEIEIGEMTIERMHWTKDQGKFPWDEVHGNFIVSEQIRMLTDFVKAHHSIIDNTVEKVMRKLLNTNSDVLTRGRQTYCPFSNQSRTAPSAYKEAYDFLISNGHSIGMGIFDWIKATLACFEIPSLRSTVPFQEHFTRKIYDKSTSQFIEKSHVRMSQEQIVTSDVEETREEMYRLVTRFASYIKHKERGKKDRRAIASAGMFLRAFLYIIEEFHLELSKDLPGSTISIGGEEKKAKITASLSNTNLNFSPAMHVIQGTEDATKWNECLAPGCFAIMHRFLFDETIRKTNRLPKPTELGKLFSRLAVTGNFFMACKEIQMGPGLMISNETNYSRCNWANNKIEMYALNIQTLNWYEEINHLVSRDGQFLRASPGMLMGMLNAGSTTLASIANNHRMDGSQCKVVTLRSSDDSMSVYMGDSPENLRICVEVNRRNLAMIGVNLSPDKTFFFKEGYGEYTSWYMDGKFVTQFGIETSSIRPSGKNPPDDFYAIAKGTATSLSTLSMNPIGAASKLRLGIDGVRRIWKIDYKPGKRKGISGKVQLLSDGGICPWNCMNSDLEEIALKERFARTDEEKDYLLRIMDPDNPFSAPIEEEITFSKEHGCLMLNEVESPRTVFHFLKRSNRTFRGEQKRKAARIEKSYAEAVEAIKLVDPSTIVSYPKSNTKISDHMISIIETTKSNFDLTEEETEEVSCALQFLRNGKEVVTDGYESDWSLAEGHQSDWDSS